ncbi:integrin alpha-M-like, partial [Fukomys damarensis]|uniref:integrin alpha-M-like n=1 Tax=Fukomys damarensis TaxID=885580 RepID=UPI00053F9858
FVGHPDLNHHDWERGWSSSEVTGPSGRLLENNIPRTNKTEFQLELPVKYAVYLIVSSGETSTKYLNFTASEKTSQAVEHQYQFSNLGKRSLPISVVFRVPVRLNNEIVWDHPQVTFSPNLLSACGVEERSPPYSDFLAKLKKTPVLNCSIAFCQRIKCEIPYFSVEEEFYVTLHGNLSFDWYIETSSNHLLVVSTAEILFNDSTFALLPGQGMFVRSQVAVSGTEGLLEGGGESGLVRIIGAGEGEESNSREEERGLGTGDTGKAEALGSGAPRPDWQKLQNPGVCLFLCV